MTIERVPIISVVPKEDRRTDWQFCYAVGNTFDEVIEGKAVALLDELVHLCISRMYLIPVRSITQLHARDFAEYMNAHDLVSIHGGITWCYAFLEIE